MPGAISTIVRDLGCFWKSSIIIQFTMWEKFWVIPVGYVDISTKIHSIIHNFTRIISVFILGT